MKSNEKINDCGIVTENYCRRKCRSRGKYPGCDAPTQNAEVQAAKNWIKQHCWERKTMNWNLSSYRLKHNMERETGTYVSNGNFIKAAVLLGYRMRSDYPNCIFNMSIKSKHNKRYWAAIEK